MVSAMTRPLRVFADHWHVVISLSVTSCYFRVVIWELLQTKESMTKTALELSFCAQLTIYVFSTWRYNINALKKVVKMMHTTYAFYGKGHSQSTTVISLHFTPILLLYGHWHIISHKYIYTFILALLAHNHNGLNAPVCLLTAVSP